MPTGYIGRCRKCNAFLPHYYTSRGNELQMRCCQCDTVLTAALFDSIDLPRHATALGRWLERRRYVKFLNDNSMGGWY